MNEENSVIETNTALEQIIHTKLVAVIRLGSAERIIETVEAVVAGGIRVVEITLTTPGALDAIAELAGREEIVVGAGTVLRATDAEAVIAAGATFCASPLYDREVMDRVRSAGAVSMPGAYTPTEIHTAWRSGADLIKLFPMPTDGASFIASLLGPLPDLRLAPSGGVNAATAPMFLRAGAAALNVGSWLTHDPDGSIADPADIAARARELVTAIDEVRGDRD